MVGAVAAADREDVDLEALEVLRDSVELVERVGLAHDAAVAERLGQTARRARIAPVLAALGVEDDANAGHAAFLCRDRALASTPATLHLVLVPTVAEQVRAARESALLVAEPDLAVLVVRGADRAAWLNGLVTCDVVKLPDGNVAYGLMVTPKGRIVTDLYVVKRGDALQVILPARVCDAVVETLDRHLVMEDVEMERDDSQRVWFAHGPKAATDLLRRLRADGLGGQPCDRTGLGGVVIVAPEADKERLAEHVASLGGAIGDANGWDALRLERGVPAFGVDFDDKTYPQEASLEKRAVSFDKGCYLGQEVVCMLELRGHVKRKLVPFVIDGGGAVEAGASVTDDAGVEVGKVSSATESPTLGRFVGLAMVKLAHASPGASLHAAGKRARVVETPA